MSTQAMNQDNNRQLAAWLLVICALIFCMIILGGVTRLTQSGLSMVDWKPVTGIIPPLSHDEWMASFEECRKFPEYQKINKGMSLGEYKSIFYFEYGHRVLGRLIGLAFLLPFLYFLVKRKIPRTMSSHFTIMFLLGGLQGLLGWYMVKSGLVHDPHVSQYRLTAHLGAAMLIYTYILWTALNLLYPRAPNLTSSALVPLRKFILIITGIIMLMILSGGFVAGTHAGLVFNDFPWMGGNFIPEGIYALQPFYINWFENLATIQFNHRMIAYLLCILVPLFWFKVNRETLTAKTQLLTRLFLGMLVIQVILGITTLVNYVPVWLGATHQGGALVLLTLALLLAHEFRNKNFALAD